MATCTDFTLIFLFLITGKGSSAEKVEGDVLLNNFFANLKENPIVKESDSINERIKNFVDEQIGNYLKLMNGRHLVNDDGNKIHWIDKRNAPTIVDSQFKVLEGFLPIINITESKYPREMKLFEQNENWYSVILEGIDQNTTNKITIYKFNGKSFKKIISQKLTNAYKLSLTTNSSYTYITVITNTIIDNNSNNEDDDDEFWGKSAIFLFDKKEKLNRIQTLINAQNANDVIMWYHRKELFMAMAQKNQTVVYNWKGGYFDVTQTIATRDARKLSHFFLYTTHFLIIAKKNEKYTEIYKYDLDTSLYVIHQKIKSDGASDVTHFCFYGGRFKEDYLIILNSNVASSIIYKNVDDYFLPFQLIKDDVTRWIPLVGKNESFALLAIDDVKGIRSYQYNGWNFEYAGVEYVTRGGVTSVDSYLIDNKPIITIANLKDSSVVVVEPLFDNNGSSVDVVRSDLLNWCQSHLQKIIENVRRKRTVEISERIDDLLLSVKELEDRIKKAVKINENQNNDPIVFENIRARKITIAGNVGNFLSSVTSNTINNVDVFKLLKNAISLSDDVTFNGPIRIDLVHILNRIEPKNVNDHQFKEITSKNIKNCTILGKVTFDKSLQVHGLLNGLKITESNLLLKDGDQILNGKYQINEIIIDNLVLNNKENLTINDLSLRNNNNQNDLLIKLINNDIKNNTLKTSGDQRIIDTSYQVRRMFVDVIRTKKNTSAYNYYDDILLINDFDSISTLNDVEFDRLKIKELIVEKNLNGINRSENNVGGALDVVFVDVTRRQKITGTKTIDNLHASSPIDLRGKFENAAFANNLNPYVEINENLTIKGDRFLNGNVAIEELVETTIGDVTTDDRSNNKSLKKLHTAGLKLNDVVVPLHLNFTQQLNVNELFADRINEIFVSSMVEVGVMSIPQRITGVKIIKNDVHVTGTTIIDNVNGIDLKQFENDVLRKSGDQEITGNHFVTSLIADKIKSNQTTLEKLLSNNKEENEELIVKDSWARVEKLKANNLILKGRHLDDVMADTVFKNASLPSIVEGRKHFKTLSVENLKTPDRRFDVEKLKEMINKSNGVYQLNGEDARFKKLRINRIKIKNDLNNMNVERLIKKVDVNKRLIKVIGDVRLNKLITFDKAYVLDDSINKVSVTGIERFSVKIDEKHEFQAVNFLNNLESRKGITLQGDFLGIELSEVVQADATKYGDPIENKKFENDVHVHGRVFFNNRVSGLDLNSLCDHVHSFQSQPHRLVVFGNLNFVYAPIVNDLNDRPLSELINKKDRIVASSASALINRWPNLIIFDGDVVVEKFINDVDVRAISNSYLSRTKSEQFVTSNLTFIDDVLFEKVTSGNTVVTGEVGGLRIEELSRTILIDTYEQTFNFPVYIERCRINELETENEAKINNLSLETDVARYDKENEIVGKKKIDNLNVKRLKIIGGRKNKVQNVDFLNWFEHVLLLNGGKFENNGNLTFTNDVTFNNGITVHKKLNGIEFNEDKIARKNDQFATLSNKIFVNDVEVNSLILNGNGAKDIFDNTVYKKNLKLYSPIKFLKNIKTKNVNLEMYQRTNVTQFIDSIANFSNLLSNEKYKKIYNLSIKAFTSFKNQANYLNHLKIIQIFPNVLNAFPIRKNHHDQIPHFALLTEVEKTFTLHLLEWNEKQSQFDLQSNDVTFNNNINVLQLENETLIQIESSNDYFFYRMDISDAILKFRIGNVSSSTVVKSLELTGNGNNCFLFVSKTNSVARCQNFENNLSTKFELITESAVKSVESLIFKNFTLLIFLYDDGQVDVIKYGDKTNLETIQKLYTINPNSITSIEYQNNYYLAIVSQQVKNSQYPGTCHILRYDVRREKFLKYQDIQLRSPFEIKFAILPTKELILYILTKTPTQPLIIFKYEGIEKFKKIIVASTTPVVKSLGFYSTTNQHFLYVQSENDVILIEAIFARKNY